MEFDAIRHLAGGWFEMGLRGDDRSPRVFVKFGARGGRVVVTRFLAIGDSVDSAALRGIPIGRIEAVANREPAARDDRFASISLAGLGEVEKGTEFGQEFGAVDEALTAYLDTAPPPRAKRAGRRPARRPLTRPDGTDPDGFSSRVAEAYNEAILTTNAPAPVLATEAGVPVVTVHRWIAEARRRGHLPPARKGRAG